VPRQARSARGEIVNFDLLKIKEQMKTAPKPIEVKAREDFIEKKLRRRVKRIVRPAALPETAPETEPSDSEEQT
jgi:hypothetical protein